jgi:hypothetical protein
MTCDEAPQRAGQAAKAESFAFQGTRVQRNGGLLSTPCSVRGKAEVQACC